MCGPRAHWTPGQGGLSHAIPLGWCYVGGYDPLPAHAGGRVTADRGFPTQLLRPQRLPLRRRCGGVSHGTA